MTNMLISLGANPVMQTSQGHVTSKELIFKAAEAAEQQRHIVGANAEFSCDKEGTPLTLAVRRQYAARSLQQFRRNAVAARSAKDKIRKYAAMALQSNEKMYLKRVRMH